MTSLQPSTVRTLNNRMAERILTRSVDEMDLITAANKQAIDEMAELTTYATYRATMALSAAQMIRQTAEHLGLTDEQRAMYDTLTTGFLAGVAHVTHNGVVSLALAATSMPAATPAPRFWDDPIGWLANQ